MSKKQIGVVLCGCGVYDGSEIHEAVLTLYFLDRAGAEAICMAPNQPQHHVINHLTGQESGETRNVLVESARISRGKIRNLEEIRAEELDAIIIPGGFGAAKNLSSIAFDGANAKVNAALTSLLLNMHHAGKPIGALCIAPAVLAKVFSGKGITVTIGDDAETSGAIQAMGNRHQESTARQIVVDEPNRIITTAAYMCASGIAEAGSGIEQLVDELLRML